MGTKFLATLSIIVGGMGTLLGSLAAFGVELSAGQGSAVTGVAGLVLLIAGAWVHPSMPVGNNEIKP